MEKHHFLIVTIPAQGHIDPARHLARRLARATGSRATLSTAISAHRRMFPSATEPYHHYDGHIFYLPYSDGFDDGYKPSEKYDYMSQSALAGTESLPSLARSLSAQGYPVTCIIYSVLLTWAVDVADELHVPSVLFWPQPATVFAVYHRYFHGYADIVSQHKHDPSSTIALPGLPLLQTRDLPRFLTLPDINVEDMYTSMLSSFEGMFRKLDKVAEASQKLIVLVNTFEELEHGALSAVEGIEMIAIGPTLEGSFTSGDLFEGSNGYMEWLDSKDAGSVVYVSFGSLASLSRQQIEEISKGLEESKRPYLWVLRKDNREGNEDVLFGGEMGMVVEWCSQLRVLTHPSVGCFVTHCGWNSMLEGLVAGVPMVMMPQWSDQTTSARLAETEWGAGVRVEVSGEEGLAEGRELRRCVDVVMGDGEIRTKVKMWREKAQEAMGEGGSSIGNLREFMKILSR